MQETKYHFKGRYLGLAERQGWEFATRTNASGVAVLVAVTGGREVILVEQFRFPVDARVIELPAGLVGDGHDPGEDIGKAAARELEEETGFAAERWTRLLDCPSTSGMSDEIITFFLAEDLRRVGPGGGDASEDIVVHLVPLDEASEWLSRKNRDGVLLDPKIYSALHWLDRLDRGLDPIPGQG
ncbi:MAG: NUDIX domain-containing protein [Xanthomonadales bacterium]|nr:NUDIX hydrolase [Xanthomonadales bacterium]NIX12581.1 NUDIX domain-containing protein [Xanthomonadales bacterium]